MRVSTTTRRHSAILWFVLGALLCGAGCTTASLDERRWPATVPVVSVTPQHRTGVDFRPLPERRVVFDPADVLSGYHGAAVSQVEWHGWGPVPPPPEGWQDIPFSDDARRDIRARVAAVAEDFAGRPTDDTWIALHAAMSGSRARSEAADTFLRSMSGRSWPEIGRRDAEEMCATLFSWATCELEPEHVTTAAVTLASASQFRVPPGASVCGNGLLDAQRCDRAMERYFSTCFRGREDVGRGFVAAAEGLDEYQGGMQSVVDSMLR